MKEYMLYESNLGMIKVYPQEVGFYADIDNRWDEVFVSREDLEEYFVEVKAVPVGYDHD